MLRLVVRLYEGVPQPDYAAICQCLMLLDDWQEVATILFRLLWWVHRPLGGRVGGCRPLAIPAVAAGPPLLPPSPFSPPLCAALPPCPSGFLSAL